MLERATLRREVVIRAAPRPTRQPSSAPSASTTTADAYKDIADTRTPCWRSRPRGWGEPTHLLVALNAQRPHPTQNKLKPA